MDEQQFKQLSDKMDIIIKLLVLNGVGGKQLRDQVLILSSFGFQPRQIADMLGKTPNHIRVLLHELRREKSPQQSEEISKESQIDQTRGESNA